MTASAPHNPQQQLKSRIDLSERTVASFSREAFKFLIIALLLGILGTSSLGLSIALTSIAKPLGTITFYAAISVLDIAVGSFLTASCYFLAGLIAGLAINLYAILEYSFNAMANFATQAFEAFCKLPAVAETLKIAQDFATYLTLSIFSFLGIKPPLSQPVCALSGKPIQQPVSLGGDDRYKFDYAEVLAWLKTQEIERGDTALISHPITTQPLGDCLTLIRNLRNTHNNNPSTTHTPDSYSPAISLQYYLRQLSQWHKHTTPTHTHQQQSSQPNSTQRSHVICPSI